MRARMIAKSSAARGRFTSAPPIALVKIWSRPYGPLIARKIYCNRVNFQEQAAATTPRLGRRSPVSESRRKRGAAEIPAAPYPSDGMICWPVSARVGNVRNNDSSLIEPVATA